VFTLAEPMDNSRSIAHRVLGYPDESYAQKIWGMNKTGFACHVMNGSGEYMAHYPVWLPGYSRLDDDPIVRESLMNRVNFMPSAARRNLLTLQKHGVDVNHLVGMSRAIQQSNRDNYSEGEGIAASLGVKAGVETVHRTIERSTHPAEIFSRKINRLNQTIKDMVKAQNEPVYTGEPMLAGEQQLMIHQEYKKACEIAYKDAVHSLNHEGKLYANRIAMKASKALSMSVMELQRVARKHGFLVSDLNDVKLLDKIGRYGKWAGKGCFLFSAALGVDEVYETYKHGGDAFKKSVGVGLELGVAYAVGEAFLLATPAGWVALAGLAIVEGVTLALSSKYVEEFGGNVVGSALEKIGDGVDDAYQWFDKSLGHWL
jgi:hypothetical protein